MAVGDDVDVGGGRVSFEDGVGGRSDDPEIGCIMNGASTSTDVLDVDEVE